MIDSTSEIPSKIFLAVYFFIKIPPKRRIYLTYLRHPKINKSRLLQRLYKNNDLPRFLPWQVIYVFQSFTQFPSQHFFVLLFYIMVSANGRIPIKQVDKTFFIAYRKSSRLVIFIVNMIYCITELYNISLRL